MKEIGWSFCIATAPENEQILVDCINKIKLEFNGITNYEIIVVGDTNISDLDQEITLIRCQEEYFAFNFKKRAVKKFLKTKSLKSFFYKSGAICHKKNIAARVAKYDNLCIMHDYVGVEPGWLKGYNTFGYDWEVVMNIILNQDTSRHRDWMALDHPEMISTSKKTAPCLIPYEAYTKYMYISGAYFCVKRNFFLKNPLNEKLFWGEGEDVEWSMRVREQTVFKMNQHSTVKYLKLKNPDGAPYGAEWRENAQKIKKILNVF